MNQSILHHVDHKLAGTFIQFIVKYRYQQSNYSTNTTGSVTSKDQMDHIVPHTISSSW